MRKRLLHQRPPPRAHTPIISPLRPRRLSGQSTRLPQSQAEDRQWMQIQIWKLGLSRSQTFHQLFMRRRILRAETIGPTTQFFAKHVEVPTDVVIPERRIALNVQTPFSEYVDGIFISHYVR